MILNQCQTPEVYSCLLYSMISGQCKDQRLLSIEVNCPKNVAFVWEGEVGVRVNKAK